MRTIKVTIEKDPTGGYGAWSETKFGLITAMGDTFSELRQNLINAAEDVLNDSKSLGYPITWNHFEVTLDAASFFRSYRIINVTEFAKWVGINNTLISQYVSGLKSPGKKQTAKILQGIPEMGQELASLDLVTS